MKSSEAIALINGIETKYNVDEWVIDGVHVWPIIRIKLFDDLISYDNFSSRVGSKTTIFYYPLVVLKELKGFLRFIYFYLIDYFNNSSPKGNVDAVFLEEGYTYIKVKDEWYDRICDPLIDILKERNKKVFVMLSEHLYFKKRHTSSMYIQPYLSFYGILVSKFRFLSKKDVQFKMQGYDNVVSDLQHKRLPCNLTSIPKLKKTVFQIKLISCFYKKILKKLKPRVSFQVAYYGAGGYAFNLACNELGIRSVDIQHGVQGSFHRSYCKWHKVPLEGYELLPNMFMCWSKSDADTINRWSHILRGNHKAVAVGNLFLKKWFNSSDQTVAFYDELISSSISVFSNKKNPIIMFTLNGMERDEVLEKLINLTKKTSGEYIWLLRCHPCFIKQRDYIKKLLQKNNISNVAVDIATDLPLYALLRHVDLHITECSSVVLEAESFNIPSIVTTEYGLEHYAKQLNNGFLAYSSLDDKIIEVIKDKITKKQPVNVIADYDNINDVLSGLSL